MLMHRILAALLLISTSAQAQDSTTHFSVAATYNTGLNYYGRVDSLHSKGFYPSVGLTLKNGLYVTSTFVFIQNSLINEYAATLLEGGYNFTNRKKTWTGSLSASKFFYQADVSLVQSAIKEQASFSLTHLNKVVNVTAAATVRFSGYTDLAVQFGLDHIIKFQKVLGEGVIILDPAANLFAGTQNFTKTEYQKKNFLLLPVADEQITTNSKRFNLLSYELSIPIIYGYKKLNLIFVPAYVLPQNLLNLPGQQEQGAPLFYLTATARVTL